jgi:predicted MPP superfamily phosphohydrolase
MNKTKKILIIAISVILVILLGIIHTLIIAPVKINVRQETLQSDKIPVSMEDFKIVFFSDVHFNAFVDEERFQNIIHTINNENPDVVLFGGDLFDHPANNLPNEITLSIATRLLSEIEADKGKFAVLGNHDLESASTAILVENILYDAGFEVLCNRTLRLRNGNSGSIVLCGLESGFLGNPDPVTPFETVKSEDYTIVLCHTPDTALELSTSKADLFLAGHGHGGQIYLPLFGAMYRPIGAEEYYRGSHKLDGMLLDITNGCGTTKADARFLADAEIVVYTLKSK